MTEYRVRWEIDVEAESPEQAAKQALAIQRDQESVATSFSVASKTPDGSWDGEYIDLGGQP